MGSGPLAAVSSSRLRQSCPHELLTRDSSAHDGATAVGTSCGAGATVLSKGGRTFLVELCISTLQPHGCSFTARPLWKSVGEWIRLNLQGLQRKAVGMKEHKAQNAATRVEAHEMGVVAFGKGAVTLAYAAGRTNPSPLMSECSSSYSFPSRQRHGARLQSAAATKKRGAQYRASPIRHSLAMHHALRCHSRSLAHVAYVPCRKHVRNTQMTLE